MRDTWIHKVDRGYLNLKKKYLFTSPCLINFKFGTVVVNGIVNLVLCIRRKLLCVMVRNKEKYFSLHTYLVH